MTPASLPQPAENLASHRWWTQNPVAWSVLVLTVGLTLMAWWTAARFSRNLAQTRFEQRMVGLEAEIEEQMLAYEQVLVGGIALMRVNPETTRVDWKTYVDRLRLEQRYPGIQGMGYAVPVEPDQREEHIAGIRAEGFPDYTIRPEGDREEYSAIIYLEPFDWRNQRAFGFDMWSNEMRRAAMRRARDEATPAISGIITLVQETDDDVQQGFLYYSPFYDPTAKVDTVENRQAAFKGWVYAAFRAGDLMDGVLGDARRDYEFEIYDNGVISPAGLLYDSDPTDTAFAATEERTHAGSFDLSIAHRTWTVLVHSSGEFLTNTETFGPRLVALAGFLINLLLYLVIRSLTSVQVRARRMAEEMTRTLRAQATELKVRNEELSQFAYVASHDLQEPISTVRSSLNLLIKRNPDNLDSTSLQLMSFMEKSAHRMHDLIKGILDYSRMGRATEAELIDAHKMVQDVLADAATLVEYCAAEITVESLPSIKGYPREIHTLFQNLLINALKYRRPEVPPRVEIGARQKGDEWIFHVRDNGIGVEQKYFTRIFEVFQRLHLQNEISGTGIGLANCRKIMELHHGRIWIESERGRGSTFLFAFPAEYVVEKQSSTSART